MSKRSFRVIRPTKSQEPTAADVRREFTILQSQIAVMTRQNGDLAATLARAEAINRQLIAEHQQLREQVATLQKGKKG